MKKRRQKIRYSTAAIIVGSGILALSSQLTANADAYVPEAATNPTLLLIVLALLGGFALIIGLIVFVFALASK